MYKRQILDKINQNGTTIVMATHDDEIVNQMRRRVIELSNGEVIRDEHGGVYHAKGDDAPKISAQASQAFAPFDSEEDEL